MSPLRITLALALGLSAACTEPASPPAPGAPAPAPGEGADEPFAAGQRWSYAARSVEPEATFLVLQVEEHPTVGRIVHVRADGLRLTNPKDASGFADTITHMPFAERALRSSARALLGANEAVPDFSLAYATWRKAFTEDDAGIFTVPLAEAVQTMENAINPR